MVRTFYWKERVEPRWKIRLRQFVKGNGHEFFTLGNAGDILVDDIIRWKYRVPPKLVTDTGSRLLLVGSISHFIRGNDVLLGIGARGEEIPLEVSRDVQVLALRGPKSYEAFKSSGFDVSNVKFQYDPGLLVRFMWDYSDVEIVPNKVIFIPHFRDKGYYKQPIRGVDFVDIDDYPENVAKQIYSSEMVYTSSLHGLIFAHALERPVKLVMPQSKEPTFKYEDYMLSIGSQLSNPIDDLYLVKSFGLSESPLDVNIKESDFVFPSIDELKMLGICE